MGYSPTGVMAPRPLRERHAASGYSRPRRLGDHLLDCQPGRRGHSWPPTALEGAEKAQTMWDCGKRDGISMKRFPWSPPHSTKIAGGSRVQMEGVPPVPAL